VSTTIVVAEDEALIRLDLVEMLTAAGLDVVGQAATGEAAVELVMRLQPDVIVLDIRMPAMDGLTAAEIIAAQRTTAIVMLTAFSEPDLVSRASEAGATAYLVKPVSPTALVPAIEVALARFRESAALQSQVDSLRTKLDERKLIERAKSRLQQRLSVDEESAYRWLQRAAMDRRAAMADVAQMVLESSELSER